MSKKKSNPPKFHPFMNEMTIEVIGEYVDHSTGTVMTAGKDLKGRPFYTPKEWLRKEPKSFFETHPPVDRALILFRLNSAFMVKLVAIKRDRTKSEAIYNVVHLRPYPSPVERTGEPRKYTLKEFEERFKDDLKSARYIPPKRPTK